MRQKKARVFVAPKTDFAFRQLLENEIVLIYLVSALIGIPVERIKGIRILNSFLWREHIRQKQGVVDALLELKDGTKITIELQLRKLKKWDNRQLFYWAKVFTRDLIMGEHYDRLKKCISIAILDFNLTDRSCGHEVYLLRNEKGECFSDMMELHTIELRKTEGFSPEMAEWIEFLNAEEESDLESLSMRTHNLGIQEAIEEVRRFGLLERFRMRWEYSMKAKRDRIAEDEYVRDEGRAEGKAEELAALFHEGLIAYEIAQARSGLSKEEFDKIIDNVSGE